MHAFRHPRFPNMSPVPIRIGGVPEHYNAPFHKVLDNAAPSNLFEWKSYPGGTGAMLEALETNEIDLAIVLSEGAIKHSLCTNGSVRILGTYVNTPLFWGVHVSPTSGIDSMKDLNERISNLTFGVSRFGSGSHLMAIVHAASLGLSDRLPKFQIVNNMDGAAKSMNAGEIDVFLWDIPTADKYTRTGVWNVIGQVSGDWPSFVFVVRQSEDKNILNEIVKIIQLVEDAAAAIQTGGIESEQYLCAKHGITENQSKEFLDKISWNCKLELSRKVVRTVVDSLRVSGIVGGEHVTDSPESVIAHPTQCKLIE